jgi:hypothetical protein
MKSSHFYRRAMHSIHRCHIFFQFIFFSIALEAQPDLPVDRLATKETINLYKHLKSLPGFIMGHQDDLAYGVGWKYIQGKSDIREVAGDYPGLYGWELGRIEIDQLVNLDSVPFDKMRGFIRDAYSRGGVITISWHLNNPLTGKTAWQPAPGTVASILPGGEKHGLYLSWLDKIASFMSSLTGSSGELIPVIFRPFHEINGSWFWWGGNNASPLEIKQLYQLTESYLRDKKNVHNLLYAYNTDRFSTKEDWLLRYPGDEWVDIGGFDIYQGNNIIRNDAFIAELDKTLGILETVCRERNKIPALTEFGYNGIPDSNWWTNVFIKGINSHRIAYALAWRNAGRKNASQFEYYVPYPGQISAADFRKFFALNSTLFQKDVAALQLYQ